MKPILYRVEDNIDVQPILFSQYDVLKDVFGDFKLSKVIEDPDKSVLVAEVRYLYI